MCHGALFISLINCLLLFIAVHQEDGIIHRHPKLQNRRQCFCNIGNLPKYNVAPQIIHNRHANA